MDDNSGSFEMSSINVFFFLIYLKTKLYKVWMDS